MFERNEIINHLHFHYGKAGTPSSQEGRDNLHSNGALLSRKPRDCEPGFLKIESFTDALPSSHHTPVDENEPVIV